MNNPKTIWISFQLHHALTMYTACLTWLHGYDSLFTIIALAKFLLSKLARDKQLADIMPKYDLFYIQTYHPNALVTLTSSRNWQDSKCCHLVHLVLNNCAANNYTRNRKHPAGLQNWSQNCISGGRKKHTDWRTSPLRLVVKRDVILSLH